MAMTRKQAAFDVIGRMSERSSMEEIMYELYFRERVDRGLQEFDEGATVTHEEVKESLSSWLRSAGR